MVSEQVAQNRLQPEGRISSQLSLHGLGKDMRGSLIGSDAIPRANVRKEWLPATDLLFVHRYGQPMDEDPPPDEVRSADEVARRSLALFSVVGLALGAERTAVLEWLSENDLWNDLAPSEAGFIDTPSPSRKQVIDASWLSERLVVLLWSLSAIDQLPPANEQCDTTAFRDVLPPFSDMSVAEFVAEARLRSDEELTGMADAILDLHWEARDASLNGRTPRKPVDLEIIQERHHAINWVIGYDALPWDEITTDT